MNRSRNSFLLRNGQDLKTHYFSYLRRHTVVFPTWRVKIKRQAYNYIPVLVVILLTYGWWQLQAYGRLRKKKRNLNLTSNHCNFQIPSPLFLVSVCPCVDQNNISYHSLTHWFSQPARSWISLWTEPGSIQLCVLVWLYLLLRELAGAPCRGSGRSYEWPAKISSAAITIHHWNDKLKTLDKMRASHNDQACIITVEEEARSTLHDSSPIIGWVLLLDLLFSLKYFGLDTGHATGSQANDPYRALRSKWRKSFKRRI